MDNALCFYEGKFPCSFDKPRTSRGTPALLDTQEVATATPTRLRMQSRIINLGLTVRGGRHHLALRL